MCSQRDGETCSAEECDHTVVVFRFATPGVARELMLRTLRPTRLGQGTPA